jgi:hypothetical protein
VASNQLGSGNTPGQSCVYAPQIGSLVVTATSAKFAIGPALLKRGADDRGNVMEPAMAADKLRASNHFTAVATHTAPDLPPRALPDVFAHTQASVPRHMGGLVRYTLAQFAVPGAVRMACLERAGWDTNHMQMAYTIYRGGAL